MKTQRERSDVEPKAPQQTNTQAQMLTLAFAAVAQGLINIDAGLNKIEPTSRVHLGMSTLVKASEEILRAINSHEELLEIAKVLCDMAKKGLQPSFGRLDDYRRVITKAERK